MSSINTTEAGTITITDSKSTTAEAGGITITTDLISTTTEGGAMTLFLPDLLLLMLVTFIDLVL